MYGYDVKAAKRLLAEAGYPKGFKAKSWLFPFAGAPELIPLMEALQIQLREVGIEIEMEETDWVANVRPRLRDRKASGYLWPLPPSKKAVESQIAAFNAGKNITHMFEMDEIYKMWEALLQMSDPKAMDEQLRKIGNYKFENFEIIPPFDVGIEAIVDPKIVCGLAFPGWDGGDIIASGSSAPVSRRNPANKTKGEGSKAEQWRWACDGCKNHGSRRGCLLMLLVGFPPGRCCGAGPTCRWESQGGSPGHGPDREVSGLHAYLD
jgi:hypothetical protein